MTIGDALLSKDPTLARVLKVKASTLVVRPYVVQSGPLVEPYGSGPNDEYVVRLFTARFTKKGHQVNHEVKPVLDESDERRAKVLARGHEVLTYSDAHKEPVVPIVMMVDDVAALAHAKRLAREKRVAARAEANRVRAGKMGCGKKTTR